MTVFASFSLDRFLDRELPRIEVVLREVTDAWLSEIPLPLREPVRAGVLAGGKRLRPLFLLQGWAAVRAARGLDERPADLRGLPDRAAIAIEWVHAYSLMHDDLPCMDDAPLRRGLPTPHRRFGVERTARGAFLLIPGAARLLYRTALAIDPDPERARAAVRELARGAGAGGMVGGQLLDLFGEDHALDGDALDDLHLRKTGLLLAAALRIGGILAGAEEEEVSALDRYGRSVGLAFQIADDLLDRTGTPEELGKDPSDAQHRKSTYVTAYGAASARARAEALVEEGKAALEAEGLATAPLIHLAHHVVDRRR